MPQQDNSDSYLKATREFEQNAMDEAVWAKAMTLARGDRESAKYEYITLRVALLDSEDSVAQPAPEKTSDTSNEAQTHEASEKSFHDSELSPVRSWLYGLMSGDFGLPRTYWLYGVIVCNLSFLVPYFFLLEGMVIAAKLSIVGWFAFSAAILVGIWRAAGRYEGSAFGQFWQKSQRPWLGCKSRCRQ